MAGGRSLVLRRYRTPLLEPGLPGKEARIHAHLRSYGVSVPAIHAITAEGCLMDFVAPRGGWREAGRQLRRAHRLAFPVG